MCHVIFNAATATPATLPRDLDAVVETIPGRRFFVRMALNGGRGRGMQDSSGEQVSNTSISFYGSFERFFLKFV